MAKRLHRVLPLLVCVLALPVCALFVRPQVELGIIDDWSYIRSAEILAATAHVVYNGWATAMLGWQLYLGALLIKLFGFSFTVVRAGTLLTAMATAALMQRLFVRLGVGEWNAAAGTLTFVLSPVFLCTAFSYMSDVSGMVVLAGCCYCCVRALEAATDRAALAWIGAAALSNALGGTARQIAWLGVLVMVPSTLWLLRRKRSVLRLGGAFALAGMVAAMWFLYWFDHQPWAIAEPLVPATRVSPGFLVGHVAVRFVRGCGFELIFLALPVLLMFVPVVLRNRRTVLAAVVWVAFCALYLAHLHRVHKMFTWEVPYLYNSLWFWGFDYFHAYLGEPPVLLTLPVRLVLTALVLLAVLSFFTAVLIDRRDEPAEAGGGRTVISGRDLCILLLPCTVAYMLLLVPRWIALDTILDRYLLFPEFVFLVFALRLYQQKLHRRLPPAVWVTIAAAAVLDTAGMHDAFALFRAQSALLNRVVASGVARTEIDGGIQFNGWTELASTGHMNDPRVVRPAGMYIPRRVIQANDPCRTERLELTPSVRARYVVSFDPAACGGLSPFAPETFHTWFGPHTRTLYVVKGPYSEANRPPAGGAGVLPAPDLVK